MPDRTYISKSEKSTFRCKESKEPLTLFLCDNAASNFELGVLLLYICENSI